METKNTTANLDSGKALYKDILELSDSDWVDQTRDNKEGISMGSFWIEREQNSKAPQGKVTIEKATVGDQKIELHSDGRIIIVEGNMSDMADMADVDPETYNDVVLNLQENLRQAHEINEKIRKNRVEMVREQLADFLPKK